MDILAEHTGVITLKHARKRNALSKALVDEVMATLEKLADLKQKGILTEDEFAAKKAELLKKLV